MSKRVIRYDYGYKKIYASGSKKTDIDMGEDLTKL